MTTGRTTVLLLFAITHLLLSTTVLALLAVEPAEGRLGPAADGGSDPIWPSVRVQQIARLLLAPIVWCSFREDICQGIYRLLPGATGALRVPLNSLLWTSVLAAGFQAVAWLARTVRV